MGFLDLAVARHGELTQVDERLGRRGGGGWGGEGGVGVGRRLGGKGWIVGKGGVGFTQPGRPREIRF